MELLGNVISALSPWWITITMISYVIGAGLFLVAVNSALQTSSQKQSFSYMWTFIVSVLLLNLPAILNAVAMTLFKSTSIQELSYTSKVANISEYMTFAMRGVMIVGLVGVVRGLNYLRDTAQRAKDMGKATTHIVGGTLGINIVQFLQMIGATAGGEIQSYVNTIL